MTDSTFKVKAELTRDIELNLIKTIRVPASGEYWVVRLDTRDHKVEQHNFNVCRTERELLSDLAHFGKYQLISWSVRDVFSVTGRRSMSVTRNLKVYSEHTIKTSTDKVRTSVVVIVGDSLEDIIKQLRIFFRKYIEITY